MGRPQGGVEIANQDCDDDEQNQLQNRGAIFDRSVRTGERKVCADGQRKRGGDQAGLPAAVPGADHDGNGKDDEAAFDDVRKKQSRDQRKSGAEHRHAIAQDRSARRGNPACAKKGEVQSHTEIS